MKVALPPLPYRFLYVSKYKESGLPYWKRMNFENAAQSQACVQHYMLIKETMESINKSYKSMSDASTNRLLDKWLDTISEYVKLHGVERVPLDIRSSCHEVQEYRGVKLTDFGPDVGEISAEEREVMGDWEHVNTLFDEYRVA